MTIKITDLPTIPSLANGDLLEIVDVSDPAASPQGTSKKVSIAQLIANRVAELDDLSDVTLSTLATGQFLYFNGTLWVNIDPGFGALAFKDTVDELEIDDDSVSENKIQNNAAANTKLADVPQNTLKGRVATGVGDPEDLTPTQVRTLLALGALALLDTVAETQLDADSVSTGKIQDDAVTDVELANVPQNTLKGRVSVGVGDPENLTPTQVRSMLEVLALAGGTMSGDIDLDDNVLLRAAIEAYHLSKATLSVTSNALTIDFSKNAGSVVLTEDVNSISLTNLPPSGTEGKYTLTVLQDATGSRVVTWPSAWEVPGGVKPVITAAANAKDKYVISAATGSDVELYTVGQDIK